MSRQRIATTRQDDVEEWSLGSFVEAEWALTERLRVALGLRADYYDWDVDALRTDNSGSGSDGLVSPKLKLAYRIHRSAGRIPQLRSRYALQRRARHDDSSSITSNGESVDPVDALVASDGAELGIRVEKGRAFNATFAAFWLELDSELVFVGDAGGTEANDGSERYGIEATAFWQANDWLAVNAAYTYTDAQISGRARFPGPYPGRH